MPIGKAMKNTIVLGADHAGFDFKEFIKASLEKEGYGIEDVGTYSTKPVDYPDYARKLASSVIRNKSGQGILACGTGIGASIAANKVPGIRAALVCNVTDARLAKEHNNANVLVLGGRPFNKRLAKKMVDTWLDAKFAGGRHARRIHKIAQLERAYYECL